MTLRVASLRNAFGRQERVEQAIKRGLVKLEGGTEVRSLVVASYMFLESWTVPEATMEAEDTSTSERAQATHVDNPTLHLVKPLCACSLIFYWEKSLFHIGHLFST